MRLPFGRLHMRHPDIIAVANQLGRTPGAVARKATNFASVDAAITSTGRKGSSNASHADRALWAEFLADPEAIAAEAEAAAPNTSSESITPELSPIDDTPTEVERLIRARRVQSFFRSAVLTSYGSRCAITGLREPRLLNASHIIPWSVSTSRRADPTNGICLNALFDRAFDRGLLTFDEEFRVVLSTQLREVASESQMACSMLECEGHRLTLPSRFSPDPIALRYHRESVFQSQ
jgi:hypothetical protein